MVSGFGGGGGGGEALRNRRYLVETGARVAVQRAWLYFYRWGLPVPLVGGFGGDSGVCHVVAVILVKVLVWCWCFGVGVGSLCVGGVGGDDYAGGRKRTILYNT